MWYHKKSAKCDQYKEKSVPKQFPTWTLSGIHLWNFKINLFQNLTLKGCIPNQLLSFNLPRPGDKQDDEISRPRELMFKKLR